MTKELLPIGSVVEVSREQTPLLMIMGYFPQTETDTADYLAAPYPIGALLESAGVLIDEVDITQVVQRGFLDDFGEEVLGGAMKMMSAETEYRLE